MFMPILNFANTLIKVAILDNLDDNSTAYNYASSFIDGINMSVITANNKGYKIEYREFIYDNAPLAIMGQIPKVKAWNPDVIIGPHFSNQFLLLKSIFPNVLVLSSYASDTEIADMPANFYSLGWSDNNIIAVSIKFINQNFSNRNLFTVVEADCKDCIDYSNIFSNEYQKSSDQIKTSQSTYLEEDIDNLDLHKLMAPYHQGDLIMLEPSTYANFQQLMFTISNYLNDDPIFINNLDSYSSIGQEISEKKVINYTEYWIIPYLFDDNSSNYREYKHLANHFNMKSDNGIAYTAYLTMMSVIDSLQKYPAGLNMPIKDKILLSYEKARKADSNWYKSPYFAVYKIDKTGYKLITKIPVN
jgi:hypothetical protein